MAALERAPLSACPACAAVPAAEALAGASDPRGGLLLSLPTIHCAACIAAVERDLIRHPGVHSARVNLTLKRVSVAAEATVTPEALIERLTKLGYEAHPLDGATLSMTETDRQGRDLLMRLGVAGFAMMNVMLLSVAVWSGAGDATRDLFHWISAAIALPTVAFSGMPFFRNAFVALRARRLGMDVPISLALILASGISVYETTQGGRHAYFDAAVMLCFFLLAGRYLDFRTRAAARSAAQHLAALEVPRAVRVTGNTETLVALADLTIGDLVRVRPGARMPVDGEIVEGTSEIDRALLTGESLPVWAGVGTPVAAGEINLTGPLLVRVTAAGRDSSLHRMADLVATAENARNRYTSLADRAARVYAPLVHVLAGSAFLGWMWHTGDVRLSLNIAVAVLIITCPCALGLAVPAVVTAASGRLFRAGMLIKDGTALERLAEVDTVVLDKTGTLTLGRPEVSDLAALPRAAAEVALALAGASSHPLALALAEAARAAGMRPAPVGELREVPGYGVEGLWQGQQVRLGRAGWVGAETGALTATHLKIGGGDAIAIPFTDRLRPGAEAAVAALMAQGKAVHLISGDVPAVVSALAARLGIRHWQAGALPGDKVAAIAALAVAGHKVMMVGDGLNDTAALAAAHVSISPATALDAARVASDIVLLGEDMRPIGTALRLAKRATRRIHENFAIAVAYNLIAVPIAFFGFATPLAAALAMSASSLTVSLNALRLR